jgi:serine/threonine protein phosphatase PrpC
MAAVKRCPTCGAACADEDLFCESDGTALSGGAPAKEAATTPYRAPAPSTMGPQAAPNPAPAEPAQSISEAGSTRTCDACGAEDPDDGDGYCTRCGNKLASQAVSAGGSTLVPGMRLGGYMVRQTAGDRATASSPDGSEVLLVVGEARALKLEAEALERIGEHRSFPRVVDRDEDPGSAFLALSAPANSARMLGDVVQNRTVEQTIAAIAALLDLAELVERAGFTWSPSPSDLLLAPDGAVLLSRLRGARKLAPKEKLDARQLLESLGDIFLAPAIRGPTRLVRLLVPSREPSGHAIAEARAEIAKVREELAIPVPRGAIAELCDPGLWRPYNQDSTAIDHGVTHTGEPFVVLVVCDGVSSSSYSERASQVAARAARDALGHFARSPDIVHDSAAAAVAQAIRAAHLAICAQHVAEPVLDPPGTTIAAALVFRKRLTVGWVGDSRAYWLGARGAELLTHDHSWVNEAIARGEVKDADEVQGALAHTITKCLGPLEVGDVPAEIEPDVRARDLAGPGLVLLCSDGLWNYAPKAADIAAVIRAAGDETNAVDLARLLVNYALARGGQDNVSVAVYAHA